MTDWQEANRVLLAWGPVGLLASSEDRRSRGRLGCRRPRKDGYACQRQVGYLHPDCCARHNDYLSHVRLEGTARANGMAQRLEEIAPFETGVYFIVGGDLVKIGRANDVQQRFNDLRTSSPIPLRVHRTFRTLRGLELEKALHRHFRHARRHGEWFDATAVLPCIDHLSDEEIHADLLPPAPRPSVRGTARDLARWVGTSQGRRVMQFVPEHIDVEVVA